jgi:hypothetical protein
MLAIILNRHFMSNNQNDKPKQPVQQTPAPKPEPKPIGIRMETFSDKSTYDKKGKKGT